MTPDEFRDLAQGFQALFLSMAAIIGGIWVLMRFGLTRERARAQLEVEKARAESHRLRNVSCELAIHHQRIGPSRFLAYIDATLLNHGPNVRVFRCDDFPFHIDLVTIANEDTSFEKVVRLRIQEATSDKTVQSRWPVSMALFPDTPHKLSFHYPLDAPGSYMFSLVLGSENLEAKSTRDKEELAKGRKFYDEHKDHPGYILDPKAELVFYQHAFVGEVWADRTTSDAPTNQPV